MRKSISLFSYIQAFSVLYIVIWSISPPLGIDLIYRLLALALAVVWIAIAFMREIEFDRFHIWALVFILAVAVIAYFENNSFSDIIRQISFYMMFVELIIFGFYNKKNIWKELFFLIPIIFLILIYYNYITITALLDDPSLARIIVRNDENAINYMRRGIGGYALVYLQVLFFPSALMWTLKAFKTNKLKFLIGALWTVSFIFLVMNAGYSIAVFTVAASVIVLFLYKGKSVTGILITMLVLFIATMALILYVEPFRNWLLSTFDGTAVAKKINDLMATSESGEAEGSIQVRIEAYVNSIKAIIRYPIIGALMKPAMLGGHSTILDCVAKYGIFGGYIYCKSVFGVPNGLKKMNEKNIDILHVANAQLFVMIFIILLDTVSYQLVCSIFIIAPILMNEIKKWTGEKNENSLDG